jgi:hypothetical protein
VLYGVGTAVTWTGVAGIAGAAAGLAYAGAEGESAAGAAVGLGFGVAFLIVGTALTGTARSE